MYKEKEVVIKELRELFDIDKNLHNGTTESDGKFYINKKQMERDEVLFHLKNYFNGVGVKNGYVSVGSMTFIHTDFEVLDGAPEGQSPKPGYN